jgi:Tol biopolymer transport system component
VTASPGGTDLYDVKTFTFATQLPSGSGYAVTVATPPSGQTCSVYKGANGTVPLAADALKAGCEWNFDHVSRSTDSSVRGTRFESWKPSIGGGSAYGEGRFVAFASSATGLSPNGQRQVFWRDRLTGETRLISTDASGNAGNANSDRPSISADGLTVVFESSATNLVAGDANGVRDVFRWSAAGGVLATSVSRVSVTSAGGEANGQSHTARVSADGSIVAYTTEAPNLLGGVAAANIIRRDVVAGTQTVVSVNGSGAAVGGSRPSISADGNRIAFWSYAADITSGDTNGLWDIFVYQHDNNTRRRVSLRADGGERNQGTDSTSGIQQPVISGNGRFVAYPTSSTNVVAGDTNGAIDIFLVDLDGIAATRRINVSSDGAQANADSASGSYWDYVAMSHDGTWIAFASRATNLGTTVASGLNLFLHNRVTGQTRAITNSTAEVDEVSITANATYLAFGGGTPLDGRFANTGLFAHFTGLGRAWWWVD